MTADRFDALEKESEALLEGLPSLTIGKVIWPIADAFDVDMTELIDFMIAGGKRSFVPECQVIIDIITDAGADLQVLRRICELDDLMLEAEAEADSTDQS